MLVFNRIHILLFFILLISTSIRAQMLFEGDPYLVDGQPIHSGVAMGFSDLNGDALDDLFVLNNTRELILHFQSEGHANRHVVSLGGVSQSQNWSIQAADVNGNGLQDIFVAGPAGLNVYVAQGLVPTYNPRPINADNFLSQGSNFADMDKDGDLDLFVCDDDDENFIALNDGVGRFAEVNNYMDFSTTPPSDGSGNYGSVFSDFDRDGDLDLYIAKCRLGSVPGDPERTNQFFLNTDSGFVRNYDHPILLSNDQSWVADWIDVDNDGDWDMLLANHDTPMNLFIQKEDGSFVDEAIERGVDFSAGVIQLVSGDYDNDGDVDVFVPGTDHILFENDGKGYFSNSNFQEGTNQIESATCGDINNDGLLDIYAGYASLYNNPTDIPDQLFINKTDGGNYIKFSLRTSESNSYAIGSTVEIFHDSTSQIRELRSGESYGINKSNIVHFGLGDRTHVDSVKVFWPDGRTSVYNNPLAGMTSQITQDKLLLPVFSSAILANKETLCDGDTITLTAPSNGDEYVWSNGASIRTIEVTDTGLYTVRIRIGTTWVTVPSYSVTKEAIDVPGVEIATGNLMKCANEVTVLTGGDSNYVVTWNTGTQTPQLVVTDGGFYSFTEERICGVYQSDTVEVVSYNINAPIIENDTVAQGFPATISSDNAMTVWAKDTIEPIIIIRGTDFNIDSLVGDSVVFAAVEQTYELPTVSVGRIHPDTLVDGYHNVNVSASVIFTAVDDASLESVLVRCRIPGLRTIVIYNSGTGQEELRKNFLLNVGNNTLNINLELVKGATYFIATDEDDNLSNLGFVSPDFMYSESFASYPIESTLIRIQGSSFGDQRYYYFYNWMVRPADKTCYGPWVVGAAIVDSFSSTHASSVLDSRVSIYPNPASDMITVEIEKPSEWSQIEVLNELGRIVSSRPVENSRILVLNNLTVGVYYIKVINVNGQFAVNKLIVIE